MFVDRSAVASNYFGCNASSHDTPKKIATAIFIILAFGGWIAAVSGVAFTLHTGTFGQLSPLDSIIVITVCGLEGILTLVAAMIVRSCGFNPPIPTEAKPLALGNPPLNTWCPSKTYFKEAKALLKAGQQKPASTPGHFIVLEQRYLQRKDVVLFDCAGDICNFPELDKPVSFALSTPYLINHTKNTQIIREHIQVFLAHMHQNKCFLPKIFIPIIAEPPWSLSHGILLVIEPLKERGEANITIINSFGWGGQYQDYADALLPLFPSSQITQNHVCQQEDGWSCGWQVLENIDLLSQVDNVQQFTVNNSLPVRSSAEMQTIFDQTYKEYARKALTTL